MKKASKLIVKAGKDLAKIKHEREAGAHRKLIREIFASACFQNIPYVSGVEFEFENTTCDIDDIYVWENVIIFCEYTVHSESHVSDHLKKKKIIFDKIINNSAAFVKFLKSKFPSFNSVVSSIYSDVLFQVRVVYCSKYALSVDAKNQVPGIAYLDYPIARYFQNVARAIRTSMRYECLEFLGVEHSQAGENILSNEAHFSKHEGSVLPETFSNYGDGFKIVSFYVQPSVLLERSYVLRRGGWRQGSSVYQRMINKSKIMSIRKYLVSEKRAFINNIVVTLPSETKLVDEDGSTVNPASIVQTQAVTIQIPKIYNSIGVVDGQHRVFSYHEGGTHDDRIKPLRSKLNLLVTGIIFPKSISDDEKLKFEAALFLEINSTQTNAKSDLKQEINALLKPFLADSISRAVINALNNNSGALNNEFERYFFDHNKLKTSSVASFGLKPLVSLNADFPLFNIWGREKKDHLKLESDIDMLREYVDFCRVEINKLMSAIKQIIPKERWTARRDILDHFLTTTNINGMLLLLRRMAREGKISSREDYLAIFEDINEFPFSSYKSSQYNKLSDDLFTRFFG